MQTPLDIQLEAILFFRGEPVSLKKLSEFSGSNPEEVKEALSLLKTKLEGRGIVLVQNGEEYMLGTTPNASEVIEKITKEELSKDLGKAGLETLAIIIYKGSASKREIDYIRGVNSGFILRNLLIRGLVEREEKEGERGYVYKGTIDLLSHLGITHIEKMPEYESVQKELETFLKAPSDEANTETSHE